jgi:hypothetical protein
LSRSGDAAPCAPCGAGRVHDIRVVGI